MSIRFKDKNRVIVYKKGMKKEDILNELQDRVEKYEKEMEKREWIYKDYLKFKEKLENEKDWIRAIKNDEIRFEDT